MEGHRNSLLALTLLVLCLQNAFPSAEGFRNFDLEEALHVNIRSGLEDALHPSTKLTKIEDIIDPVSLSKLEISIHDFVDECKARNKSLDLSTLLQFSDLIRSKGGISELQVIDLLEWFMRSMIDILGAVNNVVGVQGKNNEWPTMQRLKGLFVEIVKPMEQLVVHLFPLPPYKTMSSMRDGSKGEMRYIDQKFDNWAGTMAANNTVRTFFPRTVEGIQNIIRLAKSEGARVRASGIKHTTTPFIWGVENARQNLPGHSLEYVIAMVPQEVSDQLAYARGTEGWESDYEELVFVEGPLSEWREGAKRHASVRVGASSLNAHYFQWALDKNYTMPSNTIQLLMSIGGVATPMCHGGGIMHKTIADRILKIEYVDSNGELRFVDDPKLLPAAAGHLGLLGIVTAITYKVEEMTYAKFQPRNWPGGIEAFFNFSGNTIPEDSIRLMENSYYFEMIQFPVHHNVKGNLWMDAWSNDGRVEDAQQLLTGVEEDFQMSYLFMGEVSNQVFRFIQKATGNHEYLYWLYGVMAALESSIGMISLDKPVTTTITEAMHWERGLHYISTNLFEVNIPIPAGPDGASPNWEVVKESWQIMMDVSEEFNRDGKYPSDLGLESRLMAGSDLLMAPQHGNRWTQSIEVSASPLVPRHIWEEFKNALALRWSKMVDPLTGQKLKMRPHWAKEFPNIVGENDFADWAVSAFEDQVPKFMEGLQQVFEMNSGNLKDSLNMFSTKFLDVLFKDYY